MISVIAGEQAAKLVLVDHLHAELGD